MGNFVHLHVHTDYSFLDGCSRIDKLMARVEELGMPAVAMTDHGNMCGAIEFYNEARKHGIKPIIGMEAYYVDDHSMEDRPNCGREKSDDIDGIEPDPSMLRPENYPQFQIHHKTLIAKDYSGFLNLAKLTSESYERGFYRKPRIDCETLAKYSEGIIALSGCLNGVASQYLLYSDYDNARKATARFVEIFGRENYFIEVQNHSIPAQRKIIPGLIKLAREFGLKLVATNDTHYVRKEDASAHDAMLCIQTKHKLSDENRMRYPSNEFYIKSRDEMELSFPELPEALDNTLEVSEMVDIKIPFGKTHYPKYVQPEGLSFERDEKNFNRILDLYVAEKNQVIKQNGGGADFSLSVEKRSDLMENGLFLFDLAKKGLMSRYGVDYSNPDKYSPKQGEDRDRARYLCKKLDYELSIIIGAEFVDYFLIVYDFINWARSRGIPVGPGRGSGAGCMIAYLIRITDIDPIRFHLLFERMLSLERVSPPDFDVDFCQRRRDEVVDYVRSKYGFDRVANIVTFAKLGAKAVVRDVARVNGISFARADALAKKIPDGLQITLKKALETSAELRTELADPSIKTVFEQSDVLEGMIRQPGKHACGIIIGDQRLDNLIPTMVQEETLTTQFAKTPVEDLGLLKVDFLGLDTLTVISDAQDNVRRVRKLPGFDIGKIPLNDPATFRLLNSGRTVGVFQLESEGMRNLCRKIHLSSFEEIIALIALYRPGPMEFIPQYIEAKLDPRKLHVPHPLLKDLVRETYGVLVYQEQVMMAAQIIAGYTLGEADILRRAMGKKKPEVMKKQRAVFARKAKERNNIGEREALEIFAVLEKFAEYGFNKSHSTAYADLSYKTAYLKANNPVEFMAALLSSSIGKIEKVSKFVKECGSLKIKILGPDINISREMFTPVIDESWRPSSRGEIFEKSPGSIRFGIAAIKGVGSAAAESITRERDANGPFSDIFNFVRRVGTATLNRRVLENLIKTGAFDSFGYDRAHLLGSIDVVVKHVRELDMDARSGQTNLFDLLGTGVVAGNSPGSMIDTSRPVMPLKEKLSAEGELLGYYISGHPMNEFAPFDFALDKVPGISCDSKVPFRVCGVVSDIEKRQSKKDGSQWCFFTLSSRGNYRKLKINLFSSAYEKFGKNISEGDCVCVVGECRGDYADDSQTGELKFDGQEVYGMSEAVTKFCSGVDWTISADSRGGRFAELLVGCIRRDAPGSSIAHKVTIKTGENEGVEMSSSDKGKSSYNSAVFGRLVSDPAVLRVDVHVNPVHRRNARQKFPR